MTKQTHAQTIPKSVTYARYVFLVHDKSPVFIKFTYPNPKKTILLIRKCKHLLLCINKPARIAQIKSNCFVKPPKRLPAKKPSPPAPPADIFWTTKF